MSWGWGRTRDTAHGRREARRAREDAPAAARDVCSVGKLGKPRAGRRASVCGADCGIQSNLGALLALLRYVYVGRCRDGRCARATSTTPTISRLSNRPRRVICNPRRGPRTAPHSCVPPFVCRERTIDGFYSYASHVSVPCLNSSRRSFWRRRCQACVAVAKIGWDWRLLRLETGVRCGNTCAGSVHECRGR